MTHINEQSQKIKVHGNDINKFGKVPSLSTFIRTCCMAKLAGIAKTE